jgi:germination protein M
MKRALAAGGIVLCAALGMLTASCGTQEGAVSAGPAPSEPASEPATTTPTAAPDPAETATAEEAEPAETVTFEVWFHRVETLGRDVSDPRLFVVERRRQKTEGIGAAALEALLAGPVDREANGDVQTAIPEGTRLLGLDIDDGIATVDLSAEFESGGGSLSMQMRLAQVVYTLTQFPTVKGVLFRLDGEPVDVFSGEGIVLDHPVSRRDYEEFLPTILVESPPVWGEVGNPVTVSGSANVFEANVTVRILLASGKELARTFTTATCGTGCRGDFSVSLEYPQIKAETPGILVVHDDDAAGQGFPPHQVRIPVLLQP